MKVISIIFITLVMNMPTTYQIGTQIEDYQKNGSYLAAGGIALVPLRWMDIEKQEGYYYWPTIAPRNGKLVLGLKTTPSWARLLPDDLACEFPANYEDFGVFVYNAVRQYHPYAVEIWNEPDIVHYDPDAARYYGCSGDAVDYARLVDVAYQHAKEADENVLVIAGALSLSSPASEQFFLDFIENTDHYDILSYHSYVEYGQQWYLPLTKAQMIRTHTIKPIWLTETALTCQEEYNECSALFYQHQADYLEFAFTQFDTLGAVLWFCLDGDWRHVQLVENDGTTHLAYERYLYYMR